MLVPLFMWECGLIRAPMFYISAYFEDRRDTYYDRLLAVSRDDNWTGWIQFFLSAVRAQAEDNLKRTRSVLDLYEGMKIRVAEMTRSQYAIRALDWMFQRPIFQATDFSVAAGIPRPSAQRILGVLREGEILRAIVPGRGRRAAVLAFPELLNIAEGQDVF